MFFILVTQNCQIQINTYAWWCNPWHFPTFATESSEIENFLKAVTDTFFDTVDDCPPPV